MRRNIGEPGDTLPQTLLWLCAIPSPIGEEEALCNAVQQRVEASTEAANIRRFRNNLIVTLDSGNQGARILLCGHLDTVRTVHDGPARIEGNQLFGAGAADMKSGLALMLELAERADQTPLGCQVTLVFYAGEEGPFEENELGLLLPQFPELLEHDLAICLEPSDNSLQLGCMGSLHATVRFHGRTAHSARPWQGLNAIYRAIPTLKQLSELEPEPVELDNLLYKEVISATLAEGGRSRNIVPDIFDLNVNYRFSARYTPDEALAVLERQLAGDGIEVIPFDRAPAGKPHGHHPIVKRLAACGVTEVLAKQAWTDVGRLDQAGVPAVNFGPGTQRQAHQRNEFTEIDKLADGYRILERFLMSPR